MALQHQPLCRTITHKAGALTAQLLGLEEVPVRSTSQSLAPMKSSTDLEADSPTDAYGLYCHTERDTKRMLSVGMPIPDDVPAQ